MSTTNLKYFQLLQQIEKNPFAKTVAPAVFDIASDFRKDMEVVGADRRLSPEGKWDRTRDHLRKALRDLRNIQKPLDEYHKQTESMRASIKLASYDKTDVVAALNRRELRDASRAMTPGQRAMYMTGKTRSTDFIDAVLEQPAWVSGFDLYSEEGLDAKTFKTAQAERLQDLHGPVLDTIAERDSTESEIRDLIVSVARVDIQDVSGMSGREFEAAAKPIETRADGPWLTVDREQVIEIGADGFAKYRPASADDVNNGRVYNEAEFRASLTA
jgi:hypothetical protein